jgi:hypothetical protein
MKIASLAAFSLYAKYLSGARVRRHENGSKSFRDLGRQVKRRLEEGIA